jgi:cytochrome c oxidase subunit 4
MSTDTAAAVDTADAHDDHDDHEHISDSQYIGIALGLAVLTALEVATAVGSVEEALGSLLVPVLMIMMIMKFVVVALYFMHLKFDNKILTQVFFAGLILAAAVYAIFLSAFRFWA